MSATEPGGPRPASLTRRAGALAGLAAGAAALGTAELLAGLLPGVASPVVAVGDLVIALQPPGAKQLVVDLVGEADKLLLNLVIVAGALALAAGLGILARTRPSVARTGFVLLGLAVFASSLRDPLAEPLAGLVVAAVSIGVGLAALTGLQRLGRPRAGEPEMPDWGRRRFIGTSVAVAGVALGGGLLGRTLLDRGRLAAAAAPPGTTFPSPATAVPPLPDGAELAVEGITPLVTPNAEFYRIDTALLVPRPDVETWRLRISGMVERPFELTYDELVALPLHEQYVTIACVSNEVGGDLVGNARWTGVRLNDLLDRAGVQEGATQVVGRAVDGWTSGFPTAWARAEGRESLVAVQMNGEPLPPAHGYPARLIVPGLFGYVSATKWLTEIELTPLEAFDAYWVPLGWAKEAPILTQSRIDVPRDGARLDAGPSVLAGVAWAPDRGVRRVEVRTDGGAWTEAELSTPISDATWVQWRLQWEALPGEHRVEVRATDGTGEAQTERRTPPPPDGARGYHGITVLVA